VGVHYGTLQNCTLHNSTLHNSILHEGALQNGTLQNGTLHTGTALQNGTLLLVHNNTERYSYETENRTALQNGTFQKTVISMHDVSKNLCVQV
jgi:hypothetical protein